MFIKHEVHYFMICVAYYAESNLQISNYARKRQICGKTSKYAPDESFVANFALAERLPTSATLPLMLNIFIKVDPRLLALSISQVKI